MSEVEMKEEVDNAKQKRSILTEMRAMAERNPAMLQSILSSSAEEEDEEAADAMNVERFVAKVGRYAMKKEREIIRRAKGKYQVDYLFNIKDPNLHGDLFKRPHLASVVERVDHLLSHEDDSGGVGVGLLEEDENLSSGRRTMDLNLNPAQGPAKIVLGRQTSFLNVFEAVKHNTVPGNDTSTENIRGLGRKGGRTISSSETDLKLPPIAGASKSASQPHLLQTYSHLTMELNEEGAQVGSIERDLAKKMARRRAIKDPLLAKAPVPISYKMNKYG